MGNVNGGGPSSSDDEFVYPPKKRKIPVVSYEHARRKLTDVELSSLREMFDELAAVTDWSDPSRSREDFERDAAALFEKHNSKLPNRYFEMMARCTNGTFDSRQLLCALYCWGKDTPENKLAVLYNAFDTDKRDLLNKDQFRQMMHSTIVGGAAHLAYLSHPTSLAAKRKYDHKRLFAEGYMDKFVVFLEDKMESHFQDLFHEIGIADGHAEGIAYNQWLRFYRENPELRSIFQWFNLYHGPDNKIPGECRTM